MAAEATIVLAVGQCWRPADPGAGIRRITRLGPDGGDRLRYVREDGSEAWWVSRIDFLVWIAVHDARLELRTRW
ncbi:MAG: hypothetical protein INR65_15570 [Gluconacetobacter diazotrophicus]|nr:hypothetical protein [Gluconacetobacter diazotrophicus]